jgi:hypothetical protein
MKTAIIYHSVSGHWRIRFTVKGQKKMRTMPLGESYGSAEDAAMRYAQKGYYVRILINGSKFN